MIMWRRPDLVFLINITKNITCHRCWSSEIFGLAMPISEFHNMWDKWLNIMHVYI